MLTINIHSGSTHTTEMARVADMEAARAWLDDFAAKCRFPGEVIDFEIDGESADAAVFSGGNIKIFNIEPV